MLNLGSTVRRDHSVNLDRSNGGRDGGAIDMEEIKIPSN